MNYEIYSKQHKYVVSDVSLVLMDDTDPRLPEHGAADMGDYYYHIVTEDSLSIEKLRSILARDLLDEGLYSSVHLPEAIVDAMRYVGVKDKKIKRFLWEIVHKGGYSRWV